VNQALEAGERDRPAGETLSAFSGLALLCVLVAALAASTFIGSGEGAGTPDVSNWSPRAFGGNEAPIPSTTFYLLESDARFEEIREIVELAAAQHAEIPLHHYLRVVTLLAGTPHEEAIAYARIVDQVRSSEGRPKALMSSTCASRSPDQSHRVLLYS
jgi:hypothetical protein